MRSFKIAATSAVMMLVIPSEQSSAQMIRPVATTPSADLVMQVHSRHGHGYRRHHGNGWWWAAPAIGLGLSLAPYYYPRRYYAPYFATPYYAQPYYLQPYYARPYFARPYYGRPYRGYYGW